MYKCDYSIYLGNEAENVHVDFVADDTFFLTFEFIDGLKKEEIKDFLADIKNDVREREIKTLDDLEALIDDHLKDLPEDSLYALSAALYVNDIVYLVTCGTGEIYIGRGKTVQKLIDRKNKASGYAKENDVIVLTSPTFSTKVNEERMSSVISGNTTQAVVDSLTPDLKSGDDTGLIALFIQSVEGGEMEIAEDMVEETEEEDVESTIEDSEEEGTEKEKTEEVIKKKGKKKTEEEMIEEGAVEKDGEKSTEERSLKKEEEVTEEGVGETKRDADEGEESRTETTRSVDEGRFTEKERDASDFTVGIAPTDDLSPSYGSSHRESIKDKAKGIISDIRRGSPTGKKITLALVIVLLIIFIWSVVLGNQRRQKNEFVKKIQAQEVIIDKKLAEAEDLSTLNTQRSASLFEEVQDMYNGLQAEAEEKKLEDLDELAVLHEKIVQKKKDITRTEQGVYEEFYDLHLIEKGAEAISMYVEDEELALLDKENGKAYILSLEKKSADVITHKDIKKGTKITLRRGEAFIFGKDLGIIKFTTDERKEKPISDDKDWSDIKDFWMFNGNIYLLDAGNDEIYKYLVAEGGYSRKTSYFGAGQSINLSGATAMAIDGSVYIAQEENIMKYTSGVKDEFSVSVPEDGITFEDIYMSESVDNFYALDKDSGTIYVFSEDGTFQKQISTSISAKADDFVVIDGDKILVLVKDKIYSVAPAKSKDE